MFGHFGPLDFPKPPETDMANRMPMSFGFEGPVALCRANYSAFNRGHPGFEFLLGIYSRRDLEMISNLCYLYSQEGAEIVICTGVPDALEY